MTMKFTALLLTLFFAGCAKDLETPSKQTDVEQGELNPKAQRGLFQVINYQGLGLPQDQLEFEVYQTDPNTTIPCWGRIEKPTGSGYPPAYYHVNNNGTATTPPFLSVLGYCAQDPVECWLYKGQATGALGPKYLIMPTRTYPGVTTKSLILQCRNIYVPMSGFGFYFNYDASTNTWTTGNSAATYFEYTLNTYNRKPDCN